MEHLSSRLDQVQELWRDKEWEVSGRMQVSELEQGMSTVSVWGDDISALYFVFHVSQIYYNVMLIFLIVCCI